MNELMTLQGGQVSWLDWFFHELGIISKAHPFLDSVTCHLFLLYFLLLW